MKWSANTSIYFNKLNRMDCKDDNLQLQMQRFKFMYEPFRFIFEGFRFIIVTQMSQIWIKQSIIIKITAESRCLIKWRIWVFPYGKLNLAINNEFLSHFPGAQMNHTPQQQHWGISGIESPPCQVYGPAMFGGKNVQFKSSIVPVLLVKFWIVWLPAKPWHRKAKKRILCDEPKWSEEFTFLHQK